jgi:hypothetical protein
MFFKQEAEELRNKIKEQGYFGLQLRNCDQIYGINSHLFLLVNELSYDDEDFCPDSEIINIDSDEALRIIDSWMNVVDIFPSPHELPNNNN